MATRCESPRESKTSKTNKNKGEQTNKPISSQTCPGEQEGDHQSVKAGRTQPLFRERERERDTYISLKTGWSKPATLKCLPPVPVLQCMLLFAGSTSSCIFCLGHAD
jgi:hypothetical protein